MKEKINYKSLIYTLMSLPYLRRNKLLIKFDLKRDEDEGLKHSEILAKIIERAEKQGCIDEFWAEILKESKKLVG